MDSAGTLAQSIPITAWQQAVIVCLFIIVLVVLLVWSSKREQNWQDFIYKRDQDWHAWMDKSAAQTNIFMDRVTFALDKLTQSIEDHDDKVSARFEQATRVMSKASSRKKADAADK